MTIKASVYNIPILVPDEAECGIVGCAAMAAAATGRFPKSRMQPTLTFPLPKKSVPFRAGWTFMPRCSLSSKLYTHSQALYNDLRWG